MRILHSAARLADGLLCCTLVAVGLLAASAALIALGFILGAVCSA